MAIQRHSGLGQTLELGEHQAKIRIGDSLASPFSNEQRTAIRSQLDQILASAPFRASKRYPAFLKYVVEQTLDGKAESLKERTLGIEVFERGIEYDTNADPIVRIMASEVRKRLAQYYYDLRQTPKIRIEMPSGSYIPEFQIFESEESGIKLGEPFGLTADSDAVEVREQTVDENTTEGLLDHGSRQTEPRPRRKWSRVQRWAALPVLSLVVTLFIAYEFWPRPDAIALFWRPLLAPSKPVLLCMGQLHAGQAELDPNPSRSRFDAAFQLQTNGWPQKFGVTAVSAAATAANIAGLLKANKDDFVVKDKDSTTFDDLQRGPFVLIGAFDNDWTIRLTDSMRYHFDMDPARQQWWITDRQRPDQKIGLHRTDLPESATTQDYAIVARVLDPGTRQPVVILAGVDSYGTQVAGDFVTKPVYLKEFAKQAPRDWYHKNIEILISTSIVDGDPGPPHVVASYFW